jgi:hypothetical protein
MGLFIWHGVWDCRDYSGCDLLGNEARLPRNIPRSFWNGEETH